MITLIILRHAKSSWNDPSKDDHRRPLNDRGKHDAPRIGHHLKKHSIQPDLILASTATRVRETLHHLLPEMDYSKDVVFLDELYGARTKEIIAMLNRSGKTNKAVMIVGHNPDLSELVSILTGKPVELSTCAVAVIDFPIKNWQDLTLQSQGTLRALWRPKEIS